MAQDNIVDGFTRFNLSPTLDLDILRSFIAIAECGSMSKAAKFVYRTPAAISMQIKKLEDILQRPLLIRQARQIELTPDGETLLSLARKMLQLNEETLAHFLQPSLNGSLSIGLPDHFGTHELPEILAQFAQTYPSVQIDVVLGRSLDLRNRFEQDELDLALLSVEANKKHGLYSKILRTEPLVWVCNEDKPLLNVRPIPLALAEHGCSWRSLALQALEKSDIDYRVAYSSDNSIGQIAAVKAGLAIAAVPESYATGALKKLPVGRELPEIGDAQVCLMVNRNAGEAAIVLSSYIANIMTKD